MKKILKFSMVIVFTLLILLLLSVKSNADSVGISASVSKVEPGKTFSVTVSANNAAGDVNLSVTNGSASETSFWLDNSSKTITITAGSAGTVTVSVRPVDVTGYTRYTDEITGEVTRKSVTAGASVSVKAEVTPPPVVTPPPSTTTTQQPASTSSSSNTNNKNTTTTKKETKEEENIEEPALGISNISIKGINGDGEEEEIFLDKEFNISEYEYICQVGSNIKRIEINKDSNYYAEEIVITGLEEDLKPGENIITLRVSKDGEEVIYTIKVIKEAEEVLGITEENNEEIKEQKDKKKGMFVIVSFPMFIGLCVILVFVSSGITICVIKIIEIKKVKVKEVN